LPFVYVTSYLFLGLSIKEFTINNYFMGILYIILLFIEYKFIFHYLLFILQNKENWKTYKIYDIKVNKFIKSFWIVFYYIFAQSVLFILIALVFPLEISVIDQLTVVFAYLIFYNLTVYFLPELHIHPFYLLSGYKYHLIKIKIGNTNELKIFLTKNKFFYKDASGVNLIFTNFFFKTN